MSYELGRVADMLASMDGGGRVHLGILRFTRMLGASALGMPVVVSPFSGGDQLVCA
jgi:hypothetical protein